MPAGKLLQPLLFAQVSVVQGLPSSHIVSLLQGQTTAPPMQVPPLQKSLYVQAFPSLHASRLGVWVQPTTGAQVSLVQGFPSSHCAGCIGVPTHLARVQWSLSVQALLSSHNAEVGVNTQPIAGVQLSLVHTFLSSHWVREPTQTPIMQLSSEVQALPSSQGAASRTVHPLGSIPGLHTRQGLSADFCSAGTHLPAIVQLELTGTPVQNPLRQTSVVQGSVSKMQPSPFKGSD